MNSNFHPTAVISPEAQIGANVQVGPYCIINAGVTIGDNCKLHSHVVIDGPTHIGRENEFYPFSAIGGLTQDKKYKGEPTYCIIGDRNIFREYMTVHRGTGPEEKTVIGSDNLFLAYTHIAHNCMLGNSIIMSNCGTLAGHVVVEDKAIIGGLAAVHQFCRIGTMSIIGGCSKVVQDVPPYMMADGNPAEVRTINKVGLERNGFAEEKVKAIREAFKLVFKNREITTTKALDQMEQVLGHHEEVRHLIQFFRTSERGICR